MRDKELENDMVDLIKTCEDAVRGMLANGENRLEKTIIAQGVLKTTLSENIDILEDAFKDLEKGNVRDCGQRIVSMLAINLGAFNSIFADEGVEEK